jgi:hypothetical protein
MRLLSLLFVAPAVVVALWPVTAEMGLLGVIALAIARLAALCLGLACLAATGRLNHWSVHPVWMALLILIAVLITSFNVLVWQMNKPDFLSEPWATIYRLLGYGLPILLIGSALMPSKVPFLACTVVIFMAGVAYFGMMPWAEKTYSARHEAAARAENDAQMAAWNAKVAKRLAELARVPNDAGVQPFLVFVNDAEPEKVREAAVARLAAIPNAAEQLAGLLGGDQTGNALSALYWDSGKAIPVPEPIKQQRWIATADVARGMLKRRSIKGEVITLDEQDKFCWVLKWLTEYGHDAALAIRAEHRDDLIAIRDWQKVEIERTNRYCAATGVMDKILAEP